VGVFGTSKALEFSVIGRLGASVSGGVIGMLDPLRSLSALLTFSVCV